MVKTIIDVEHEYPVELTVDSVDSLAGKKNSFHKLVLGIGILPSKAMKKKKIFFRLGREQNEARLALLIQEE